MWKPASEAKGLFSITPSSASPTGSSETRARPRSLDATKHSDATAGESAIEPTQSSSDQPVAPADNVQKPSGRNRIGMPVWLRVASVLLAVLIISFIWIEYRSTLGPSQANRATLNGDSSSNGSAVLPSAIPTIKVRGSAWVTMKSGESQIIRGMRLYVVGPTVRNQSVYWNPILEDLANTKIWCQVIEKQEGIDSEIQSKAGTAHKEAIQLLNEVQDLQSKDLLPTKTTYRLERNVLINSLVARTLLPGGKSPGLSLQKDETWPLLVAGSLLATCYSDASGNFEVTADVPPGSYIYASHSTSREVVEWLVPIGPTHNGEVKADLFDENTSQVFPIEDR